MLSKSVGSKAIASLPFPVRRRLVSGFLAGRTCRPREIIEFARSKVPFYQACLPSGKIGLAAVPLLDNATLAAADRADLLARDHPDTAAFVVAGPDGAMGYLSSADLATLGAAALAHPLTGDMAAALKGNPMTVNALPYTGSVLGHCGQRLASFLGGCVANVPSHDASALALALVQHRPSVVLGTTPLLLEALDQLATREPQGHRHVLGALSFFVNLDPSGPLSQEKCATLERYISAHVIDGFTDGFSFVFLSCRCGLHHPPKNMVAELVDEDGRPTAGSGRLVVTDLARRTMPLIRYQTPFQASLGSASCPFVGQTTSVTCHGRADNLLASTGGPVGKTDVERQISQYGLVADFTVTQAGKRWRIVLGSHPDGLDLPALKRSLENRFGVRLTLKEGTSL